MSNETASELKLTTERKRRILKEQAKEFRDWLNSAECNKARAKIIQAKYKEEHDTDISLNFIRDAKRRMKQAVASPNE